MHILPCPKGDTSHYYGFDGQQNARFLTDAGGNVTDIYVYTAFRVDMG